MEGRTKEDSIMISESIAEYMQTRLRGGSLTCRFILGDYQVILSRELGCKHNLRGDGWELIPDSWHIEEGMIYGDPYMEVSRSSSRREGGSEVEFKFFYAGKVII